jgi:twitching motility two-component system response regulator PilH
MKSWDEAVQRAWISFRDWLSSRGKGTRRPSCFDRSLKVLCILSGEPGEADIVRHFLEPKGCRITTVSDGQHGLDLVRLEEPDVVIVDELAPGMGGFGVYTAMKMDAQLCRVPLVFIARRPVPHQPWGNLRDKDIVHFPVSSKELIAAVEYVLTDKPRDSTPPYATLSDTESRLGHSEKDAKP